MLARSAALGYTANMDSRKVIEKNTVFSLHFYAVLFLVGIAAFIGGLVMYFCTRFQITGLFVSVAGVILGNCCRVASQKFERDAKDLGLD
jgi:uncharacterized membrane-anchored protein